MKRIIKFEAEPQELTDWKLKNPRAKYDKLNGKREKQILKQSLLGEQFNICCYCGMNLTDVESHIEHVIPQATRTQSLNYMNMHVSCNGDNPQGLREGKVELNHCGMHKRDNEIAIIPTQEDCENRFKYLVDGSVEPINPTDEEASVTMKVLNLNTLILKDMRKAVIDAWYTSIISEDISQQEMTVKLEKVVSILSNVHNEGLLSFAFQTEQIIKRDLNRS